MEHDGTSRAPPTRAGGAPRSQRALVLLCLLAFFAARLALMHQAPTRLYEPEEYLNLRLAASLWGDSEAWGSLSPPSFPDAPGAAVPALGAFQYQDFDGGTLAVALTAVPLVALFGLSVAAVKAGALLWTGLTLLLWLEVLARVAGPRGRLLGAAAFALGPATWVIASSVHWGNHNESAFGPPAVLLLGWALRGAAGRRRLVLASALGLVTGLSVWFSQLNLLAAGTALLASAAVGRLRPRDLPLLLVGLLAGLFPRLLVLPASELFAFGAHDRGVGDVAAGLFGGGWRPAELLELWASQPALATWDFEGLGVFPWSVRAEQHLRWVLVACFAAALLSALASGARPPRPSGPSPGELGLAAASVVALPALLQPAALLASGEFQAHRLVNLYPLACACVGLGAAGAARGHPLLGLALLLLWGVPNAAAQATLLAQADRPEAPLTPWAWFAPPSARPVDRTGLGIDGIDSDLVLELDASLAQAFTLPAEQVGDAVRGLGYGLGSDNELLVRRPLRCEQAQAPSPAGPAEAWGFGSGLRIRCRGEPPDPRWCDEAPPSARAACLRALRGHPPAR